MADKRPAEDEPEIRKMSKIESDSEDDLIKELDDIPGYPEVKEECSLEVTQMINSYFEKMKEQGVSVARHIKNRPDFSSPDMLPNVIKAYNIKQFDSNLPKEVWSDPTGDDNPNGIRPSDMLSVIAAELCRREQLKPQQQQPAKPNTGNSFRRTGVAKVR